MIINGFKNKKLTIFIIMNIKYILTIFKGLPMSANTLPSSGRKCKRLFIQSKMALIFGLTT